MQLFCCICFWTHFTDYIFQVSTRAFLSHCTPYNFNKSYSFCLWINWFCYRSETTLLFKKMKYMFMENTVWIWMMGLSSFFCNQLISVVNVNVLWFQSFLHSNFFFFFWLISKNPALDKKLFEYIKNWFLSHKILTSNERTIITPFINCN